MFTFSQSVLVSCYFLFKNNVNTLYQTFFELSLFFISQPFMFFFFQMTRKMNNTKYCNEQSDKNNQDNQMFL